MTPFPAVLEWIASHPQRFARKGYKPPNHLANGEVRWYRSGDIPPMSLDLDAAGKLPIDFTITPTPTRVEVYGGDGALLYAEDAM